MPRHDPVPPGPNSHGPDSPGYRRRQRAWDRYRQLMSWMVIAAIVAVLVALLYLKRGGGALPASMVIATIAGVSLSVLLGAGLMGLVFVSNSSGHDDEVAGEDDDERS